MFQCNGKSGLQEIMTSKSSFPRIGIMTPQVLGNYERSKILGLQKICVRVLVVTTKYFKDFIPNL